MHATEKILAAHAGRDTVTAGEIVNCVVDVAGINDLYLQTVRSFFEVGGKKVHSPEKVLMFMDHYAPASTIAQAANQKQFREFCSQQGIENLMDVDQGVCHQVAVDKGFSRPGRLIVITDSHTTTHGALGAFGSGVGATDMATILISGQLWFRVPEVIKIVLSGKPRDGVYAKDIILHVIGELGADFGVYKVVEFAGDTLNYLSISERLALCNMTTEMGAKTAWIQPDSVTFEFLKEKGITDYTVYETDPDYVYLAERQFDVSALEPQIAEPASVDNVFPLSHSAGTKIDQAFLGTCTGGRIEDLEVAAQILKGRHVSKGTRFIVVPASKNVLMEAMRRGVMQTLVEAGAVFVTPGCAACLGTHEGMLASGETCITASSRNFPGRMGSPDAHIFLGSPAAVAAAALTGEITDPTPYLQKGGN
ncbi:MAG: 3-isopropylmalate dehydratase large subunit [Pyramidobacter sp.]|nr:3-isopropylmalate dehydratase large subunit [Pyramidobacter sp.]